MSQGIPLLPAGERSPRLRLLESKVLPSGTVTLNYAIQYRDSPKKPKKAKKSPTTQCSVSEMMLIAGTYTRLLDEAGPAIV
jgi:hypothetical protein